MAIGKAVAAGIVAGAGIAHAVGHSQDWPWPWLLIREVHLAGHGFLWSWPVFVGVTLFTFAMLAWSKERG